MTHDPGSEREGLKHAGIQRMEGRRGSRMLKGERECWSVFLNWMMIHDHSGILLLGEEWVFTVFLARKVLYVQDNNPNIQKPRMLYLQWSA